MKTRTLKKMVLAGLAFTFLAVGSFSNSANADGASDQLLRDQRSYPFLYPGFQFAIQPVGEGGLSLYALYDGEGFIVCSSGANPSNEVVTAMGHCNSRLTPPGYHITPDALFGRTGFEEKFKTFLKVLFVAIPQIAETHSEVPMISEPAQALDNVSQQSIVPKIQEQYQLSNVMAQLKVYAKKGDQNCDATPPSVPAPFFMADLTNDIQSRIQEFKKNCDRYSSKLEITDPKIANNPEALFCRQQNENLDYASQVMRVCNIPAVTAQAGEPGFSELWFPGQPVLTSCLTSLKQMGLQKDGNPVLDANGFNIQPDGVPLILWLEKEQKELRGLAPTSADDAIAEHESECLLKNPGAQAKMQARLRQAEADLGTLVTTPDPAQAPAAQAPSAPAPAAPVPATP